MARRPRLLEAAAVIALAAGCAHLHPARGGLAPAAGAAVRHSTTTSPPAQGPAIADPATTTPTGDGPAAAAARFALAYLDSPPGDNPETRRQRCRPYDTDNLDALLAAPTWDGATNPASEDQGAVAAIDAINPVDDNAQGAGYELTITTTTATADPQPKVDRLDVQLWVTTTVDGWRVSQVSVT